MRIYGDQSGEFVCGQLGLYKGLRSTYKLFEGGVHVSFLFITSTLKSLAICEILLALSSTVIYFQIAPFFALNRVFFPANGKVTLKQHN